MDRFVRGELLAIREELARAAGHAAVQQRAIEALVQSELAVVRVELGRVKAHLAAQQQDIAALKARLRAPEGQPAPGGGAVGSGAGQPALALAEPASGDESATENDSLEDPLVGLSEERPQQEEKEAFSADPPEEFFLYCVLSLTCQDPRARCWAACQLVAYIVVYTVLCGTFSDSCLIRSFMTKWAGGGYDQKCFYIGRDFGYDTVTPLDFITDHLPRTNKTWWDIGSAHIAAIVICLWLVALYFKRVTVGLLTHASIAEGADYSPHIRALVFAGEVVHTVVVPCSLATGTALQLAQSADVADIILNAFAVTFIMELDRTLYELALTSSEKGAYQALWYSTTRKLPPRRRHVVVPNVTFCVDLALLLAVAIASKRWTIEDKSQLWLRRSCEQLTVGACLVRAVVLRVALWREGKGRVGPCNGLLANICQILVSIPVVGLLQVVLFRIWLSADRVLDRESIIACSGGNSTACHC